MDNDKIVFVGLLCLDIVSYVDGFPAEDSDHPCKEQFVTTGGNAANNCKVWHQLSKRQCMLLSSLGDDWASLISENQLSEFGGSVDMSICSRRRNQSISVSVVLVNNLNGTRTILHNKKDLLEPTFEEFREKFDAQNLMNKISWIHFEGRNIDEVLKMIDYIVEWRRTANRNCKPIISVELEKPKRDIVHIAKNADFIFLGKDFAQNFGYNSPSDAVRQFSDEHAVTAKAVICGWGEKGACAINVKDGTLFECPATAPGKIVDTLGAGDTFIASCISKLIENETDIQNALQYACLVAGAKCCIKGFSGLTEILKPNVL